MRLRVGWRCWLWRWCWIWQSFLGHERRPPTMPTHFTQQSFNLQEWVNARLQLFSWASSVPCYTKTTSIMLYVGTTALECPPQEIPSTTEDIHIEPSASASTVSSLEEPPCLPHFVSGTSPTFLWASKVEEASVHEFHRLVLPFPIYSPPILVLAFDLRKQRPSTWSIILADPRNLLASWEFRRAAFYAQSKSRFLLQLMNLIVPERFPASRSPISRIFSQQT